MSYKKLAGPENIKICSIANLMLGKVGEVPVLVKAAKLQRYCCNGGILIRKIQHV